MTSHQQRRVSVPRMSVDPVRSKIMRAVGRTNTKPEIMVRRSLHALGFRFRLHRKDLPGTPDLVVPKLQTAVFVHGCFWHRHDGCSKATTPKTRAKFWALKFSQNVNRDRRNVDLLHRAGWSVLTIWECETTRPEKLTAKLATAFKALLRDQRRRAEGRRKRIPATAKMKTRQAPPKKTARKLPSQVGNARALHLAATNHFERARMRPFHPDA
jgi:DNA mismatch endonuclease, patch repair protein